MHESFEEMRATRDGHEVSIQCLMIQRHGDADKLHYHDYIEILYMLSGQAQVITSSAAIPFSTGDLIVINSKEPHSVSVCKASVSEYIVIKLKPQILYSSDFSLFEAKYMIPFVIGDNPVKIFTSGDLSGFDIKSIMQSIYTEWESMEPGYEMLIRAEVLRLFTWIIRFWSRTGKYDIEKLNFLGFSSPAIQKLITLAIEENKELSCADAAKYCNMSYSYFSRVFKRIMGMSYTAYLMQLRINHADRMLATTNHTITEIAATVGFSSDAYFIKCFRECKGITPAQYRAKLISQNRADP